MKYLEDPQVFKFKGDNYDDGLFTLPSKNATILPFKIGRSGTLEDRPACLVSRALISINVLAKDNDMRDLFQIAGYNSPKNPSDVMALCNL